MAPVLPEVARMFVVGMDGTEYGAEAAELLDAGVGGILLFKRNYASLPQLLRLTAALKERARRPLLIAVDHEGGRVQRFGPPFTLLPPMAVVGRLNSLEVATALGQVAGAELRAANVDVNFAPVVDVNTNPANPVIGDRALGSDPRLVAALGGSITAGLQDAGVAACLKHFPGHGDTAVDSHLALPFVNLSLPELEATHFRPFREIIASPGPAAVMTSHIVFERVDPLRPATMSPTILQGLLRERFGFQGVIFSDCIEMKAIAKDDTFDAAVVDAVTAGVDMLIVSHSRAWQKKAMEALSDAVRQGRVPATRIQEAHRRIDALFQQYVRPPAPLSAAEVIGCAQHQAMRAAWRSLEEDSC